MKKAVILQSNYLPWKGYFDLIHDADVFVFYDEVKYTKNDWRNRNQIYGRNGLQWLTIPISHDAVKLKISEVVLGDSRWQTMHFKTLYHTYRRAPHFDQLEPIMDEVLNRRQWTRLSELNRCLIERISRCLNITTEFADSKDFELPGGRMERLVILLQRLGATEYITGPSAKDYAGYPQYRQLREPFQATVSIVDMLANIDLREIPHYIWAWRGGGETPT